MTNIILIAIFAVIFAVISLYNRLVRQKNLVSEAWSGMDVQLKRRHDLIPNIVETVKGYASHEKGVLEKVTQLRNQAIGASSVDEKGQTENALSQSIKTLFAVAENYPNLKANENFLSLQKSLSETEDQIQMARRYYNGTVRDYQTLIQTFPVNMMASSFNFTPMQYFQLESDADRQVPNVKLN